MNRTRSFDFRKAMVEAGWTLAVFALGTLAGVFVHYALHRLMLAPEPFIYVIF